MSRTPDGDSPEHERWLHRTADIRNALATLMHPASLVQARDTVGMQWMVRILGLDSRSRLMFWRPHDSELAAPCSEVAAERLAGEVLEFTATSHEGAWLQFQPGLASRVDFGDGSLLMISAFPARLRHELIPR